MGNDLTDMRRIEEALEKHGSRFADRCFTKEEIAKAEQGRDSGKHVDSYAKRFAAKEACSKALGTGFSKGVFMKDIGVINDTDGKPALKLSGGALKRLEELVPQGMKHRIHLSLTDEPPLAGATVIIEAIN
jgi:holo-[acyl-carrier protein] synthase